MLKNKKNTIIEKPDNNYDLVAGFFYCFPTQFFNNFDNFNILKYKTLWSKYIIIVHRLGKIFAKL